MGSGLIGRKKRGSKKQKGTELGEEEAERRQRRHKGGKMKRGGGEIRGSWESDGETEKARKDASEQRREIEWGGVVGGG